MAYESSVPYRAGTEKDAGPGPAQPAARAPLSRRTGRGRGSGPAPRNAPAPARLPAACSGPVCLDRGSVGPLHGKGGFSAYSTITFRRIPVEEPV
ncbi:hypothetical protein [Streptomyces decoyicus]|uniref:hypothetical protein n=1 Tax=Streptomyces decoyicus TaxID=249567 RepID=UPI00069E7FA3|nr:hypothetical protein [Streptomyces decoyicus]KOG49060.1 hypothetical protein ADK74_06240 [Streptomyces decoyicus]QZY15678.1 hypothetical protein K7C20_10715 [Streptomyces decoyicus]